MKWGMLVILFLASNAAAQDDPVATARHLAQSGDRAQAIAILEQRLRVAPADTDARTLYGAVLSWNRDFAHARRELEIVLLQQPSNEDARLALARVELWSGHPRRAEQLLAAVADDPEAAALRAQARREGENSEVVLGGTIDEFQHSDSWREAELEIKRPVSFGSVILRAAHGHRFGRGDNQLEVEAYPRTGPRSYAYVNAGFSPHADLYPRSRFGFEFFQNFGAGYEASLGYRRLNFATAANISTASLSKYYRDWLFTLRGYHSSGTNSAQLILRRYLGSGANYVGLRIGKGSTRDEIRSATDIQALDSVEAAVEAKMALGTRWSLQLRGGAGRQDLPSGRERDTVGSALLGIRF